MARARIQLEVQRDFTGGLNLKDDIYNLDNTETFDLQNVDIDRRGGFGIRRGRSVFIAQPTNRNITATGASRTGNVVTATGLSPVNGDPDGLKVGHQVTVNFADDTYDGTFTITGAVGGATTATWAQVAANDASAGAGTIVEGFDAPDGGYTYVDPSGTRHILAARAGWVKRWDGTAWQDVLINAPSSGRTIFAEAGNTLYILRPNGVVPNTWAGSGLAPALTTAVGNYNDDLTAPNQGNFPVTNTMVLHHEVMWAGGVNEATGFEDNRIRWSHTGQPQDWRTNDFIDIDKDDEHGRIRALVPFGDRLLVFKDKAVYAIHGYPPAGFSVQNLTKDLGTPNQAAVVATEDAVYFWDIDKGLWEYDGKQFKWVFEPLFPIIEDNKLNLPFSFQSIVAYHNDRVWVSVPWIGAPYGPPNQFIGLVYAPNVGKRGAWTVHTETAFGWWNHRGSTGGDVHLLGGDNLSINSITKGFVMELDTEGVYTDASGGSGITQVPIDAWFTTRWFDAKNTAMKKRWKRPVVVMRGGQEQRTIVQVLKDYNPVFVTKSFDLITTPDDVEGEWDVDDWDEVVWAATPGLGGDRAVVLRGAPLGPGIAMALRFKNTVAGQDWRVHGLTMKWIPRTIRN